MPEIDNILFWTIISFVVGALFGTGAVWKLMAYRILKRKHEIEEMIHIAEIRENISNLQQVIIEMSEEYVTLLNKYKENPDSGNDKIRRLKTRLDTIKDDFSNMEANLAKLEGREPRTLQIDFIPIAPPRRPYNLEAK